MRKNSVSILSVSFFSLAFSFLLFSCGGGSDTADGSSTEAKEPPKSMVAEEPEPIEVSEDGSTVTVRLTGDDLMKYNLNRIEVKEGQTVKLTLTHIGKMPIEAMGHNFVLLEPGITVQAFAEKAATFKDNNYIPEGEENVIVHTGMVGGGQSTSIEFQAPPKGEYKYLCSFPAHYVNMQGDFIVN
ncbi:MAG: azurin [Phaeodactylibacter sp.]|nr:azurin [Phaeodactylibacter sp.]